MNIPHPATVLPALCRPVLAALRLSLVAALSLLVFGCLGLSWGLLALSKIASRASVKLSHVERTDHAEL
jgi:hypothetical protein